VEKFLGTMGAIVLALAGVAGIFTTIPVTSAGLRAGWPDLPVDMAATMIALLAVGTAMLTAEFLFRVSWTRWWKSGWLYAAILTAVLSGVTISSEYYLNHMATEQSTNKEVNSGTSALAAFDFATTRKPQLDKLIADLNSDRETVKTATTKAEIISAQRLMSMYEVGKDANGQPIPYYAGPIDGDEQGLTRKALSGFGMYAQGKISEYEKELNDVNAVIKLGKPKPRDAEKLGGNSHFLALAISVFTALAFFLAELALRFSWREPEESPDELDDGAVRMERTLDLINGEGYSKRNILRFRRRG